MFDWAQKVELNDLDTLLVPLNDVANVWLGTVEIRNELFFCNIFKNPETRLFDVNKEEFSSRALYTYIGLVDDGVFISQVSGENTDDTRELFFKNTEFWQSEDSFAELTSLKNTFLSDKYRSNPIQGLPNVFKFTHGCDLSEILIFCIVTERSVETRPRCFLSKV